MLGPPEGNDTAQIEAVAAGLADLAVVNTYYLPRYAKDADPTDNKLSSSRLGSSFPIKTIAVLMLM